MELGAPLERLAGQPIIYLDLSIGQCDHFRQFGPCLGNHSYALIGAEHVSTTATKGSDPSAISILCGGNGIAFVTTMVCPTCRMASAGKPRLKKTTLQGSVTRTYRAIAV